MRFYSLTDVPVSRTDVVCRNSPVKAAVPFAIFTAITLTMVWVALRGGIHSTNASLPSAAAYWIAVSTGLFGLLSGAGFSKSLHRENWLVRITPSGLLIKYRSFMNRKLPAGDTQVFAIEFSELAWVRESHEVVYAFQKSQDGGPDSRIRLQASYLELKLANGGTAELEEKLRIERAGHGESHLRHLDYPVTVAEGGVIRVRWKNVTPSLREMLGSLSRSITVAPKADSAIDFINLRQCTSEEKVAAIRKLVENGHPFEATRSTEILFGYSNSDAIRFVKDLDER